MIYFIRGGKLGKRYGFAEDCVRYVTGSEIRILLRELCLCIPYWSRVEMDLLGSLLRFLATTGARALRIDSTRDRLANGPGTLGCTSTFRAITRGTIQLTCWVFITIFIHANRIA